MRMFGGGGGIEGDSFGDARDVDVRQVWELQETPVSGRSLLLRQCDLIDYHRPVCAQGVPGNAALLTRCIDPDGSPTRFSSLEDGTQAGKMDCLCARDIYITTEANLNLGQLNCEGWGSYKALQTGATKTCVTRDGVRCSSVYTPSQPDCCLPCSNVGKCRPSDLPLCNNADSQDFTDYCFLAALTSDSYLP
ncbi:unnamed protein product [Notodromas monacha]|uniref:Uncharacterized protein n=1 Tax=Notodromas monacha TaxID=399045 RepID=A0A7R9GCB7_9CRUS|nr:unnamed protein product [Notodromas monacha]CAG0917495.1 unnamed protein product [Notodromas monacha]